MKYQTHSDIPYFYRYLITMVKIGNFFNIFKCLKRKKSHLEENKIY